MNYKRYVGVIIKHDGKFLICKRNPEGDNEGMWSIPAGKLEPQEDLKKAAFYLDRRIKLLENGN